MSDAAWIAVCAAVPLTITAITAMISTLRSQKVRRELTDKLVETTFREAHAAGAVQEHRRRLTDRAAEREERAEPGEN